ncbi:pentatricopeptide repeat-containing protein At3g29230-like [Magnolia sinica]|uniref:pentatricopeptide repeat-containing protein At3g29230-like n=1 Tax=Magnolia sinica TaxID=86752 RepID=UPI00265836BF|nr:pentatricopeptide repeat-containing protein At3g29230-like [Magnolia sinica]
MPPMPSYIEEKISRLLQDCTFKQLKQIHAFSITNSLIQTVEIPSKLLRRSTEFGRMDYAELVFSDMEGGKYYPEIFLWNHMIRGYAYNGPYEKCIYMFEKMPERRLEPNRYTYPYVLKACLELGDRREGEKIHCRVLKGGLDCVLAVSDTLLNFYIKMASCSDSFEMGHAENGRLGDARKIFDGMVMKPVELWNRMISEYVNFGEVESGRSLFDEMPQRDVVSWNSIISGYTRVGDVKAAEYLFKQMPERNVVSWTSMVGAFANSGDLRTARGLFNEMPERNTVSWNSMISNYNQCGEFQEALDLFVQMQSEDVILDGFTFVSALSACAHLGSLELGKWIHFHLMKDGFQLGVIIGTALIEMYAKCGDVDNAFRVFIKMVEKDVFCWNVMIKSLAIHGRIKDAIKIFSMIQREGFTPNSFTFTSSLFACNHGGLVEEGQRIFESMKRDFGMDPKIEHYGCLIDLLGRNGRLEEAHLLAREMPFEPDVTIWGALLGGCRVRSDIELAEKVMERIVELRSNESGVYVLLSNIYALEGQWPEALRAREKMEERKIWKKAGSSSVLEVVDVGV